MSKEGQEMVDVVTKQLVKLNEMYGEVFFKWWIDEGEELFLRYYLNHKKKYLTQEEVDKIKGGLK